MKPLYLSGTDPLTVVLDGPALRVSAVSRADRLFPLRRLSRVVVAGDVSWSTGALLACSDHGVPVSFLTREGLLRARVLGPVRGRPALDLGEALAMFLETRDGAGRLRDWMAAEAQHARLGLSRRLRRAPRSARADALRRALAEQARRYAPEADVCAMDGRLVSLLAAHLEELLGRVGLRPEAPSLAVHEMDMVGGLTEALVWSLQIEKLRFLWRRARSTERRGEPSARLTERSVTAFYESQSGVVERGFHHLMALLHGYLLEVGDTDAG